jgi:hypothetical protein
VSGWVTRAGANPTGGTESRGRTVIPDGTVRDAINLPRGYWEAKDTADDLQAEIGKKIQRGYPLSNIIFEDTQVLRDVINATIGFEQLAAELRKSGKSLHRMLGPNGNPRTANFFAILQVLQKHLGVKLTVKAA